MKRERLPEKYATLRVITSNKNTTKQFKNEMNPMYKVGMLVRIRLRGVWRKAKIVDRTEAKILVVYKNDRGVFSEEWITPSARKDKKENKEASKPCNSLGEKLSEMRRQTKSEKFNWRIQRWLDSSDGLSDEEDDEDMKEKPQDMKCPEDHEDDVPRKRYPIDFTVRTFLTRDKKQQIKRRPNNNNNNNAMESKHHSILSPPKRPSFTNTFDRNLLEKIRVSERELRKKLNYHHRYQ